ncbi:TIM44-like domain-containing protein [Ramlibacter solisilvae]|uniref:Preprotein translocase subunit Tim44 n=1 Tax=Ramlibacter tataouinensis TaxID=94132 RepID=A0A127JZ42_9BURK|nr:Tim44-like domain-containing protein [Ramlibacter tataouinensis]AMO25247.1 preprotein translocase subunit Tim44 [Ramlibacter tataouinensis]
MKFWSTMFVVLLALGSLDAEAARRLGGGSSVGRQSGNVTQREAQRTPPAGPAQNQAAPAQNQAAPAAAPGQAAAAAAPKRPWGAMLGGLAAGLGLAWLAHTLGLGEAFGQFLLIALLVMLAMMAVGMIMRSRRTQAAGAYAYPGGAAPADVARPPPQYSPDKIGNDASARPWERSSMAFEAGKYAPQGRGVQIGSALGGPSGSWEVPAGFDIEAFTSAAKRNFISLQDAWDRSDVATLRAMMTDDMLGEIKSQLTERENQLGGRPNKTDVVMLEAQLLGIEDMGDAYMASVEFSGMIREEPSAGPSPFREVWNMTKPKSGPDGWLVAGVQALQ